MSRSSRQSPSPDWQASLLEAIQQRDASTAIPLAQRCVHRQGMATLHTLLDRADAAAGTQGEARDWLLLLLKHAETRPQAPPPDHARAPQERTEPGPASTAFAPPGALPSEEALSSPEESPAFGAASFAPLSTPPRPSERPLARSSGSEALDQAFAPLEIAFPPLPSPERSEKRAPTPEPATAPPPLDALRAFGPSPGAPTSPDPRPSSTPVVADAADADARWPEASAQPEPSSRPPAGQPAFSAPPPAADFSSSEEPVHRLEHFPTGVAAPVPSFHGDALERRSSSEALRRSQPPAPEEQTTPPPRAKSLQAWRAWLPGAFRPRPRA